MERIVYKNSGKRDSGDYVLYWMQQSQRAEFNPALEMGIAEANRRHLPLVVLFVLTDTYSGAGRRHYRFMLQGLEETRQRLAVRGIGFCLLFGDPVARVVEVARGSALLIMDSGYTRLQRQWRRRIIEVVECSVRALDGDLVIPPLLVSDKEEYAAATIRKKIHRQLPFFLKKPEEGKLHHPSLSLARNLAETGGGIWEQLIVSEEQLSFPEPDVPPVSWISGGRKEGRERFDRFIAQGNLERFHEERNDPARDGLSHMSPYLHYGQISALELALEAASHPGPGSEAFLEELVVRRELAFNYVLFNPRYDSFDGLPSWAREDLEAHSADPRDYIYSEAQLEAGETHDPYWNGAQKELVHLGKIHGYMRMYWGKKILEWTAHPREGFRIALTLNDRYSLDGRDPNGYAGVAWCFGKHDRPWANRKIFGKVRYMNDRGLERKFRIREYCTRVDAAVEQELQRPAAEVKQETE